MKIITSINEGTNEQLKDFISSQLRAISPKTGKQIKINTFKMNRHELIEIVKQYENDFIEFVKAHSITHEDIIEIGLEIADPITDTFLYNYEVKDKYIKLYYKDSRGTFFRVMYFDELVKRINLVNVTRVVC